MLDIADPTPTRPVSNRRAFDLRIAPAGAGPADLARDAAAVLRAQLHDIGAVLLRGYGVSSEGTFEAAITAVTPRLLDYDYASTPRSRRKGNIYTSTEYPPHQRIPPHNEMSYSSRWPAVLWFCCIRPAVEGGATPLVDSREVYANLDPGIRRRFAEGRVLYVRNYGTGLDLDWPQAFDTSDQRTVEAYCRSRGMSFAWKPGGVLKTWQVCDAISEHPVTRARVWFNQAHLFHVSALEEEVREALLEAVDPDDLPRNAYYGDGAPIEESVLAEVRATYDALALERPWQAGDVLLVDNVLVAHGRAPFVGPRTVLVAMA